MTDSGLNVPSKSGLVRLTPTSKESAFKVTSWGRIWKKTWEQDLYPETGFTEKSGHVRPVSLMWPTKPLFVIRPVVFQPSSSNHTNKDGDRGRPVSRTSSPSTRSRMKMTPSKETFLRNARLVYFVPAELSWLD